MTRTSPRREWVLEDVRRYLREARGVVLDLGGSRSERHRAAYAPQGFAGTWMIANLDPTAAPDVVADAHRLPFPDATVDHAVLIEVVEHLSAPEAAMAEVLRVLRPGGDLFLTIPFAYRVHADPDDYRRLTPSGLRRLLAGFEILSIEPQGGPWTVLACIVRDILRGARPRHLPRSLADRIIALAGRLGRLDRRRRVRDSAMLAGWTTGYGARARRPVRPEPGSGPDVRSPA